MIIFCTIYYILSYIESIPKIIKLIKTKSSNDYSLMNISLQLIALSCWSLYIFTSQQKTIVYIGTITDLILIFIEDVLILKFYKFDKKYGDTMKKKLILFDWGNIVESHTTGYSCRDAWDDLFRACGSTEKGIFDKLSRYKLTSIMTIEDFEKTYIEMAKDFNLSVPFEEFVKLYKKYFDKIDYYKEVADYEVSLHSKCSIGILSNLALFDKERLDRQVNLSKYDYVFLSFEMGLKKPSIKIYEEVQKKLPFAPEDILFIDDRLDNVETAKKMGWNAVQLTGLELEKIKKACQEFLND